MKTEYGQTYAKLEIALQDIPRQIGVTPKAVLVISAHWEEPEFTITANEAPGMIYDFSGFPEHTFHINYPALGSPELSYQVQSLLRHEGFSTKLDLDRGFDHGMYSALYPIYPKADVPIVQLSLKRGLDPATHMTMGRALKPLRQQGVLIIGSGLSYHNLQQFGPAGFPASREFDEWLQNTLLHSDVIQRAKLLKAWEQAPSARAAHPREEHLLPLMVALGAARDEVAHCVYHERTFMGGLTVSSFRFG
jgi:aromatic ring-opening dioxygenase catalytic subunit (LigB family)